MRSLPLGCLPSVGSHTRMVGGERRFGLPGSSDRFMIRRQVVTGTDRTVEHWVNRRLTREQWIVVAIFLAALALRLAVFAYISHEPRKYFTYDSSGYDRRATNLLDHGVFAGEKAAPFTPDLGRTPGYPVIMAVVYAVIGHQPAGVVLLQILAGALTAVLTYVLVRELQLSRHVGGIAAAIVALDPVSVMTSNRLLTETIFTTLIVAAMWMLARYWQTERLRWIAISAVILAGAALTRPISQFLPLAVAPLIVLAARTSRRHAQIATALFLVLSLTLTYSWAYRNYRETGVATLSSISDTNLIYYRARAVLAASEGKSQDRAWAELEERIDRRAAAEGLSPAETIALERREAIRILAEHPLLTIEMLLKGVARIFADPGYTISCTLLDRNSTEYQCFPGRSTMNEPGVVDRALGKVGQMSLVQQGALLGSILLLGVLYTTAILGVLQLARDHQWRVLGLLMIVIAYFTLLSAGAEANGRFRIPMIPFLAVLAGVGIEWVLAVVRSRRIAKRQTMVVQGGN